MSNLDPYTSHWLDQGGRDSSGQTAWSDLADDSVDHGLHRPSRLDEASADMDRDVMEAVAESKARQSDESDWELSREHRTWLSERYPDTKLDTYCRGMLDWNRKFQTDPHAAKEEWVRVWSRMPPFHHRSKAAAAKAEPPEGMRDRWKDDWQRDEDIKAAYKEAAKDRADRDQYSSTSELRQQIRQATGLSVADFLEKCRMIDTASLDDPAGIANRFAIFSGAPATEREAAEQQHAAQAQALHANLSAGYQRVIDSGKLPGAGTERVDSAIVAVLEDPRFQRSGDYGQDLEAAYHTAIQWLAAGYDPAAAAKAAPKADAAKPRAEDDVDAHLVAHYPDGSTSLTWRDLETAVGDLDRRLTERLSEQSHADKARKASRSISGAPSPGATSNSQRHDASVEDDVRRAYRSASTSASV